MRDDAASTTAGETTSWFRRHKISRLGIVVAAAALGLAACGGGSPDSSHVASLGTSTTTSGGHAGGSGATTPKGKPTQLMDEWATCMRAHGDPGQTDPTVDQYGVIHADIPESVSMQVAVKVHAGAGPCAQYVLAAEKELRAAYPAHPLNDAEILKYVECMRANGVPNYPSPGLGADHKSSFKNSGVDPNSPHVEKVNKVCGTKLHLPAWYTAGVGVPGTVDWTGAGYPNGGKSPPACFFKPLSQGGCTGEKPFNGGNGGAVPGG